MSNETIDVVFEDKSNKAVAETAPGFNLAMQDVIDLPNNNPVLVMRYCGSCEFSRSCALKLIYDRGLNEIMVKNKCLKE